MRTAWKIVVAAGVFAVVGAGTAWMIVHHAGNAGPQAQIRLAGEMAGLFAGGAAALLVGIGLVLSDRRK